VNNSLIPEEFSDIYARCADLVSLQEDPKFVPTQAEKDRHVISSAYLRLHISVIGTSSHWGQIAEENIRLRSIIEELGHGHLLEVPGEEVRTGSPEEIHELPLVRREGDSPEGDEPTASAS